MKAHLKRRGREEETEKYFNLKGDLSCKHLKTEKKKRKGSYEGASSMLFEGKEQNFPPRCFFTSLYAFFLLFL